MNDGTEVKRLDFGEGMECFTPYEQLIALTGLTTAYGFARPGAADVVWGVAAEEVSFGARGGIRYVLEYREWLEHCVRTMGLMADWSRGAPREFMTILSTFESWEQIGEFGNALIACARDKGPY